jgi:hypothetical protein
MIALLEELRKRNVNVQQITIQLHTDRGCVTRSWVPETLKAMKFSEDVDAHVANALSRLLNERTL